MDRSSSDAFVPFLKWAGGKRWFVKGQKHLLTAKYNRFIEPFLGSGAVYFRLAPTRAILSDSNPELINAYTAIRDDWKRVLHHLEDHQLKHCKEHYYHVRCTRYRSLYARAAAFIYLNRTCWNGLYRVNLKGEFNVPIGTKSSVLLGTDNFQEISALLSSADIRVCDFEETLHSATKGDFTFVDPPYTVKHDSNGFIKYNEGLFSWDDQVRLRNCVAKAIRRGAKVLVTNAHHSSITELYEGLGEILTVTRSSVISGSPLARGKFSEVVIKCF